MLRAERFDLSTHGFKRSVIVAILQRTHPDIILSGQYVGEEEIILELHAATVNDLLNALGLSKAEA